MDVNYLKQQLKNILAIPSPTGYTDEIVHYVGEELKRLKIPFELTRRGAIRAMIKGKQRTPCRAVVSHLDTIGAMVRELKSNGRLAITPIGTWPSRFAEGSRAWVFTPRGGKRGTILALKASGHAHGEDANKQPVNWDQLEIRIDEACSNEKELFDIGFRVGDFVAIDPGTEFLPNGYIVSRHLDDKAGVAAELCAAQSLITKKTELPVDCYFLFTITEEVGSGITGLLQPDVAEMVAIDNATPALGQTSTEWGVTVGMMDSTGPFDYHLTQKLIKLAEDQKIPHVRDVFRYYRCDSTAAVESGNDLRTALICFGADASHWYERTHVSSLEALSKLLLAYVQSPATVKRDKDRLGPLEGFPTQPKKKD